MHDAGLDRGLGKSRVDGVREAFEAVHDGDQDVLNAPVSQVVHHREPEFGSFIGGDPQPQNLTLTLRGDAQGHVNGLVFDLTAFRVADFDT